MAAESRPLPSFHFHSHFEQECEAMCSPYRNLSEGTDRERSTARPRNAPRAKEAAGVESLRWFPRPLGPKEDTQLILLREDLAP